MSRRDGGTGPSQEGCSRSALDGWEMGAFTRSAFVVKKMNNAQPNWLRVGLAFSTSAALWAFLIKQHNEDVMEYERRNKRGHKCTGCS
ncbi:NADH dehydrogenase [ubiquinone] 1 subunit C1, mitochondrial isoform X1 [Poecile atricapillus]|uniref:NADH dehydrogenase [ubiquinone] 1 subunit C1, mitochondrial isoform X1 n=1 Tax=Poecile atricapillus TaxID=48891 RepID=UPI0027393ABD|nr:NADH dehydrogenase [ubiquinone] 1 subunit C1, mitochondrial isoform X1 [Poecile atricapillus]